MFSTPETSVHVRDKSREISPLEREEGYGGKDLEKRWVFTTRMEDPVRHANHRFRSRVCRSLCSFGRTTSSCLHFIDSTFLLKQRDIERYDFFLNQLSPTSVSWRRRKFANVMDIAWKSYMLRTFLNTRSVRN